MGWLLICDRSGRFWRHATEAACYRAAQRHGLKDYYVQVDDGR